MAPLPVVGSLALRFAELLQECNRVPLDATAEPAALAGAKKLHEILVARVKKFVQVDATIKNLRKVRLLGPSSAMASEAVHADYIIIIIAPLVTPIGATDV